MRPWLPGSGGLCSLHVVPHPFCSPQEELKQTAPPQEDEAAKVEEEAAEEVGAGLLSYTRAPGASHPLENVPERDPIPHRLSASLLGS